MELKKPTQNELAQSDDDDSAAFKSHRPTTLLWKPLSKAKAKELWRILKRAEHLFSLDGEWFSASRDERRYVDSFSEHVLSSGASPEAECFVLSGKDEGVWTTIGEFIA